MSAPEYESRSRLEDEAVTQRLAQAQRELRFFEPIAPGYLCQECREAPLSTLAAAKIGPPGFCCACKTPLHPIATRPR